jgi:NAD(P)-dependent dehydrogenase (short-subunit alcohol dehydrogenase family)
VSRSENQLRETARLIGDAGGTALVAPADVTDRSAVEAMVRRTEDSLGPVDVLLNNAGSFNTIGPVYEIDADSWWNDITINLLGPFLCSKAVLPGMMARDARPGGRIINMIGGGTGTAFPNGSAYGSSKAALMRFTESLDKEVFDKGIVVIAMGPGLVRTAMTELQLNTEAGKRWMSVIKDAFEAKVDVPPTLAAELAVQIASGRCDALHGRALQATENLDETLAATERIIEEDLKTLRMRGL